MALLGAYKRCATVVIDDTEERFIAMGCIRLERDERSKRDGRGKRDSERRGNGLGRRVLQHGGEPKGESPRND